MTNTDDATLNPEAARIIGKINKDELVQLTLDLCNIDRPVKPISPIRMTALHALPVRLTVPETPS